ncbi:MAG: tRNA threonylcarbamoyladenosine biosynthesis protein TsaE [Actinomycetota bacterium]|nr:tRNA threonylcarbamoyladenosine biosynthesis protein TsaE [Actinomycetota bacterium]
MTLPLPDEAATERVGRALAPLLRAGDVVILDGPLGAGKTTFTRGLGQGLGIRGPVTSPTFVIARVHPSQVGGPDLVHVDAYRLTGPGDFDDLDLEADMAESVTVVEWGRGVAEGLAADRLLVTMAHDGGARVLTATGVGPRWAGIDVEAALAQ